MVYFRQSLTLWNAWIEVRMKKVYIYIKSFYIIQLHTLQIRVEMYSSVKVKWEGYKFASLNVFKTWMCCVGCREHNAGQSGVDRNAFSPNTQLILYPSKHGKVLPSVLELLCVSWPQLEADSQKNDWQLDAETELKAVGSTEKETRVVDGRGIKKHWYGYC